MLKKIITILSLFAFCLTVGVPAWAGEQEIIELSLEEAIEIALEDNPEIPLSKNAIAKAKVGLREAKSRATDLIRMMELAGTTLETLQGVNVGPRVAEMNILLAEMGAEFTEKGLRMKVEKAYYDVLKAEADFANRKRALARAKEQLRLAQVSVLAGVVAESDVMGAQVGVTNGEVQLASAQNDLDAAMMSLAKALGRDLTETYSLTDKFKYIMADELDLNAYIAELMEQDISVVGAKEGLAITELQFEQVAKMYSYNVYAYKQAQYDRDEARIKYDQAKTTLSLNARQSYLNLKTAEKAYLLLEENVQFAEETARLAALRYESGVATRIEMEQAFDQLNETEAQRLSMLYKYNLAKTQLEYGLFIGGTGV